MRDGSRRRARGASARGSTLRNGNARRPAALITLSGDDLVVVLRAQVHSDGCPRLEVAADVDGAADRAAGVLLWVADRPELLEGLRTINGWLVDTSGLQDGVRRAIAGHGALLRRSRGRVVTAVRFNDVVLDEGATRPSVDGEVAVAVGGVCTGIADRPVEHTSAITISTLG